jgi:hypothetical protein
MLQKRFLFSIFVLIGEAKRKEKKSLFICCQIYLTKAFLAPNPKAKTIFFFFLSKTLIVSKIMEL